MLLNRANDSWLRLPDPLDLSRASSSARGLTPSTSRSSEMEEDHFALTPTGEDAELPRPSSSSSATTENTFRGDNIPLRRAHMPGFMSASTPPSQLSVVIDPDEYMVMALRQTAHEFNSLDRRANPRSSFGRTGVDLLIVTVDIKGQQVLSYSSGTETDNTSTIFSHLHDKVTATMLLYVPLRNKPRKDKRNVTTKAGDADVVEYWAAFSRPEIFMHHIVLPEMTGFTRGKKTFLWDRAA